MRAAPATTADSTEPPVASTPIAANCAVPAYVSAENASTESADMPTPLARIPNGTA